MGAGIPTTATYIILVAVAAPALAQLQVQPLVAHFFVFYYGVQSGTSAAVRAAEKIKGHAMLANCEYKLTRSNGSGDTKNRT